MAGRAHGCANMRRRVGLRSHSADRETGTRVVRALLLALTRLPREQYSVMMQAGRSHRPIRESTLGWRMRDITRVCS